MSESMYKLAAMSRFRFDSRRGPLSTEDLYDLPLAELDTIAKAVNKALKEASEESFISPVKTPQTALSVKLEILKDVIATKLAEAEARKKANENKARRQRILEIVADKQDESLKGKSMEELTKMLNEME